MREGAIVGALAFCAIKPMEAQELTYAVILR